MTGHPQQRELDVHPDYEDGYVYGGRSVRVSFASEARLETVVCALGSAASQIETDGLAKNRPTEWGVDTEVEFAGGSARIQWAVTAELAVLMLRLAANHLRQHGIPNGQDEIIATDPFNIEFADFFARRAGP